MEVIVTISEGSMQLYIGALGGWVNFLKIKMQIGTRYQFGDGGSNLPDSQNIIKKGYGFVPKIGQGAI